MTSATCYQIRAGAVRTTPIPDAGLPLLASKAALSDIRLIALPGVEDADWASYTLERVAEIAATITPWAVWYCSANAIDGTRITPLTRGLAYDTRDVIWLRSARHPDDAIMTAFHESYHSAEKWMTGDEIEVLRRASEGGPVLPRASDYNAYWCRGEEVRARAFAAWAYSHWLMSTTPTCRWRMLRHERLWVLVYTGGLAFREARRGHVPADKMPDVLRRRLAERGDGQRLYDAVRRAAVATGRAMLAAADWALDALWPDVAAPPVRGHATRSQPLA